MTQLSDRECGEIVAASLAPDRILSGIDGYEGSRPDVLLTTVDRILTDRVAAARAEGARDMRTKIETLPDEMAAVWGGDAFWLTTGNRVAALVRDWLNEALADGGAPQ